MKKITCFCEHLNTKCLVSKAKLLFMALVCTSVCYAQVPSNNLIGSYYFNDGSPYFGAEGTESLTPSVSTATSQVVDRNGTNNAIQFNNALFRSDLDIGQGSQNINMHYSFWVKTNQSDTNERTIIDDSGRSGADFSGTDRGYYVFLKQGKIHFKARYRDANSNYNSIEFATDVTVNDNIWHHIAIDVSQVIVNNSYDFSGTFYVDNVLQPGAANQQFAGGNVLSFDRNGAVTLNNNKDRNLPAANRFNGELDDLHIYNRTLSNTEITSIYNDTSDGFSTINPTLLPLLFSYSFDPNANLVNDETSIVDLTQSGTGITNVNDRFGNANSAVAMAFNTNFKRPNINITNANDENAFSYSFWIKTNISDNNRRTIIDDSNRSGGGFTGNERGYFFYMLNGNVGARVRFITPAFPGNPPGTISRGVESSNVSIADNNWHHIVFTVKNEDLSSGPNDWQITTNLYVDGVLEDTDFTNYVINSSVMYPFPLDRNGNVTVNNMNSSNLNTNEVFKSSIDDIKAFSGILTQADVTALSTTGSIVTPPCNINIPDANFKAALLADAAINTNGNGEIECSEASTFTGPIVVNGQNIADLTGLENFPLVTELFADSNNLTTVDFSQNPGIARFVLSNNQITSLDVSNQQLFYLGISDNPISSLDLSNQSNLQILLASDLALTSIDISDCSALEFAALDNSQLTSIDTSNNTLLETLSLSFNQLTTIDLSQNPNLTGNVLLNNNNLSSLNIANGNNGNIMIFSATNNPNLSCIQIDSGFTPPATSWFKDASASYSDNCAAATCIVSIPDANFKAALIADTAINTNGNTEIECTEATAYTGTIFVNNQNIADLTGIETFVNATELYCANNQLSTINLTANTNLTFLGCAVNQLTTIDVSNNTQLLQLYVGSNQLNSIDVSQNTLLTILSVFNNQFTTIDVSNNTALLELTAGDNQFTDLDISQNTNLQELTAANNALVNLNLSNGNNGAFQFLDVTTNPALSCIQIDSGFTPPTNGTWLKDATASYSDNCAAGPCVVNIPDANFKAALVANNMINTNNDTEIQCNEASVYTGALDLVNQNISDLTGLETFTSAVSLNVSVNNLSVLDISNNTNLESLFCINSNLTNLDITNNTSLKVLNARENQIQQLDLSMNTLLEDLNLIDNQITTIDVSNNLQLIEIALGVNLLSSIDLTNNTLLTNITAPANPNLTSLNIANGNNTLISFVQFSINPNLSCIQIDTGFTPPTDGTWQKDATATYSDNCANLSVDTFNSNDFKLYPNPVSDILNIETNKTIKNVELFSVLGKSLQTTANTQQLDVSELNSGIYFLKIYDEKGNYETLKFIKQ